MHRACITIFLLPALVIASLIWAANSDSVSDPRVELGRLLFFDPVLSADNDISCAHCHHPRHSLTDGLVLARGRGAVGSGSVRRGGVALDRNTPSLWNAGTASSLFWDGRVETLEDQARDVLTHPAEMASDPLAVEEKLRAIPEYQGLFARAFPDMPHHESLSFDQVCQALAAFQRTLVSDGSPFDRYREGDLGAITESARRGWKLFLSPMTRCSECHDPPSFRVSEFKVIGTPEIEGGVFDAGRERVSDQPFFRGAFKVPSLRNVALTSPYMHNGSFATLEEVVDFYANADGLMRRAEGLRVDDFIRPFVINATDRADLVNFLESLTDERRLPEIPVCVPSGLPVVDQKKNASGGRSE